MFKIFLILRSIGIYVFTAQRRTPTMIITSKIDKSDILIDFRSLIYRGLFYIKQSQNGVFYYASKIVTSMGSILTQFCYFITSFTPRLIYYLVIYHLLF